MSDLNTLISLILQLMADLTLERINSGGNINHILKKKKRISILIKLMEMTSKTTYLLYMITNLLMFPIYIIPSPFWLALIFMQIPVANGQTNLQLLIKGFNIHNILYTSI